LGALGAAVTGPGPTFRLFEQLAEVSSKQECEISQSDAGRQKGASIRWIRPVGAGNRSGADWHNAARLADIDAMIQLVGPGGTGCLVADSDAYRTFNPIAISHGGTAGNPVKIAGVDSAGKQIE
jgi:hypothetical protein